ncbi:MAG TPA: adenylate/guanylate cyclase domain-containing protein [Alkalispirochaeta sp.]|nr:adenylate/guanylate cyclase domain-containing protein [Alkalispirochaeta sp.]
MDHSTFRFVDMVPIKARCGLYAISLVSTAFLTLYSQLVCPFLESRPFWEIMINLVYVFIFQTALREVLFRTVKLDGSVHSLTRKFYRMIVLSWIITGLVAVAYHEFYYIDIFPNRVAYPHLWPTDYPWHSHLKVLSGYWFLGAGLLSQLELSLGERSVRRYVSAHPERHYGFTDRIANRITWGNFNYAFVPSVAVLIMVVRYAFQDRIIPVAITAEISYIGVVFVGTAIWAAVLYGRVLKEDTARIVDAVQRIGTGDFEVRLLPTRQDELGRVAAGINEMAEGLAQRERIRESFGHFVSPQVAERFISQYAQGKDMRSTGDRKSVAVLMCDLRDFSGTSESMDPSDVARMLNTYFDHMVTAIEAHGGMVDKFIGDAVMAVFGLLDDEEHPAKSAVRAALEIRTALGAANQENQAQGLPHLENGIGIHYGEVIASYLGSSSRLEFTVIGSTVNIAARLESLAKSPNPPLIISEDVADQIKDSYAVFGGKTAQLKGVGEKKIYSIKEAVAR